MSQVGWHPSPSVTQAEHQDTLIRTNNSTLQNTRMQRPSSPIMECNLRRVSRISKSPATGYNQKHTYDTTVSIITQAQPTAPFSKPGSLCHHSPDAQKARIFTLKLSGLAPAQINALTNLSRIRTTTARGQLATPAAAAATPTHIRGKARAPPRLSPCPTCARPRPLPGHPNNLHHELSINPHQPPAQRPARRSTARSLLGSSPYLLPLLLLPPLSQLLPLLLLLLLPLPLLLLLPLPLLLLLPGCCCLLLVLLLQPALPHRHHAQQAAVQRPQRHRVHLVNDRPVELRVPAGGGGIRVCWWWASVAGFSAAAHAAPTY